MANADPALPSRLRFGPVVEARSKEREDLERVYELLVFVHDSWLSLLELVQYGEGETGPLELPPPHDFEPASRYEPPEAK
jgi:hypothetical protein